jgi:flagellar protein FlaG
MQPVASTTNALSQTESPAQTVSRSIARDPARAARAPASPDPIEFSKAQVKQAIDAANAALMQVTNDLEFAVDSATGQTVVRVIDASTQQVIRQFPTEEMLAIARALDRFQGMLIRQKA